MRPPIDVVILGAGVAGLVAARLLRRQGLGVMCLETFADVGGNHRSRDIAGFTFDVGSIVFNSGFPFFAMFPSALALCVPFEQRIQRIVNGTVRDYPFEVREALAGGPVEIVRNAASLLAGKLSGMSPVNVAEHCRKHLGDRLYVKLGLKAYVERFYGIPDHEIDVRFADQRMQFVTNAARLDRVAGAVAKRLGVLLAGKPEPPDVFHGLVRPRAGFPAMYGAAQAELEAEGVVFRFGVDPGAIRKVEEGFEIGTGHGVVSCRRLVSTIPVSEALRRTGLPAADGLVSSDLLSLYVSFEGRRGFSAPILYNFDGGGPWKRLTMHSDAYGLVGGREYFSVEIPKPVASPDEADAAFSGFVAHVRGAGLFDGDIRLEGAEVTQAAYPAYTVGSTPVREAALDRLDAFGIETAGRQGRFDYLPTIAHVGEQVERELGARRRA
jgi:hypothetical protein